MKQNKNYISRAIGEKTWRLTDRFGNHCYLLEGSERAALIDAGIGLPGLRACVEALTERPVTVLLTHGHLDHTGGAGLWDQVRLHRADSGVLRLHQSAGYRRLTEGLAAECGVALSGEELHACVCVEEIRGLGFWEEGSVDLGDRTLEVLHTPGHTRGSVCLLEREREFLFSGDTVCQKRVMLSFPESEPPDVYERTVRRLLAQTGSGVRIFPGHNACPAGRELLEAYLDCAVGLADLLRREAGKRSGGQGEERSKGEGCSKEEGHSKGEERSKEEERPKEGWRPKEGERSKEEGRPKEEGHSKEKGCSKRAAEARVWEETSVFGRCLVYRRGETELTFTEKEKDGRRQDGDETGGFV